MGKYFFILASVALVLTAAGEAPGQRRNVGEQLWEYVGGCDFFADSRVGGRDLTDEIADCRIPPRFVPQFRSLPKPHEGAGPFYVYEPDNGYLHVDTGPVPTCGCSYAATVVAYGRADGYLMVSRRVDICSQNSELAAGRPLEELLPFTLDMFYHPDRKPNRDHAYFYLDLELPREGADTRLIVRPAFINRLTGPGPQSSFSPLAADSIDVYFWDELFLESKTDWNEAYPNSWTPSRWDLDFWSRRIIWRNSDGQPALTPEQSDRLLSYLMRFYQEYRRLQYHSFILGWDRARGSFYIKEKVKAPPLSFLDFLRGLPYYSPSC